MCLDKETGAISHQHFYELPEFLKPGDCLILNNSRVLPARLLGQRLPGGGACEVLLLIAILFCRCHCSVTLELTKVRSV